MIKNLQNYASKMSHLTSGGWVRFVAPRPGNRRSKVDLLFAVFVVLHNSISRRKLWRGSRKSLQHKLIPIKMCNSNLRWAKAVLVVPGKCI